MNHNNIKEFFAEISQLTSDQNEAELSKFATPNKDAVRLFNESEDPRTAFALDRDRILYSGAFRRYSGKTQVIYFASQLDEMLTSRIIHTLSVSQVARTIGKFLKLNDELIEAIALSHDLGHSPFGHDGEKFLSQICVDNGIGEYHHHIQSLHIVDHIAKKGRGLNLTFQVRDGILSHDGEVHDQKLTPNANKYEADLQDYIKTRRAGKYIDMMPNTFEGCVMRISDTIAYIGQDIEDAIRIGLIERMEIPLDLRESLGETNGEIMDTLIKDVIYNSYEKGYVSFSQEISEALKRLKDFNYKRIYLNEKLKGDHEKIIYGFEVLFKLFLNDLERQNKSSLIYKHFLNSKEKHYLEATCNAEKVRDYIAGMTDRYYVEVLKELTIPNIRLLDS
jgi:dGTPase